MPNYLSEAECKAKALARIPEKIHYGESPTMKIADSTVDKFILNVNSQRQRLRVAVGEHEPRKASILEPACLPTGEEYYATKISCHCKKRSTFMEVAENIGDQGRLDEYLKANPEKDRAQLKNAEKASAAGAEWGGE